MEQSRIKLCTTMKKALTQQQTASAGLGRRKPGLQTEAFSRQLLIILVGWLALNVSAPWAKAAPTVQLLSVRNSSAPPLPAGGDGDSIAPVTSPDGRYVVFSSEANDLTPGGNGRFVLNVYLRDRTANTTVLVSANTNGTGGGNDNSTLGQVSSNGQFVVFQSDASDSVPNDTNGVSDIFVRNLAAGTTTLVSMAPDGSPANGASTDPVMTPDGRYVAFISSATNLVAGDTNGIPDVFVRDLVLGSNYLISGGATGVGVPPVGTMATPSITPDGRYVAFFSTATNLVPGVPVTSQGEVYVYDRIAGTTTWASTNAAAIALADLGLSNAPSYHPRLSDDGQSVAFKVGATNSTGAAIILLYDLATATTTVINTNGVGWNVDRDGGYGPEMTPDGDYVAYVQHESATNLSYSSVHVWDVQGAMDTLVSDPGVNGVITTTSMQPELTADGWFVAFLSNATNLVDNPVTNGFHIYLRNYLEGSLQLVDEDTNGIGSTDNQLTLFSLSLYGRYIAFDSPDGSLVSGDNNQAFDVFVRDLFWNTTELISQRNATVIPQTGDNFSWSQLSVSSNGQWVAFASVADDLLPNDTNKLADVFVRDLLTGTTTLVSAGADGDPAWDGHSLNPVISADGRYVVFLSTATNLAVGQGATFNINVFRRDLQTGTTVLVSVSTNGVDAANGDCAYPVISQDGRYVAFLSKALNLFTNLPYPPTGPWTIWRDINSGTTAVLPTNYWYGDYSIFPPSMSSDGRYVAYSSHPPGNVSSSQLAIWDSQLGTDIYTNSNSTAYVTNAVLSANGMRVLYNASGVIFVDDVLTGTNICSFNYPVMKWRSAGWSADGRYFTFVAQTNTASGTNIYLCDIQTGAITVVSSNYTPMINNVSGDADLPVISSDGRFVAYRSYATGIVPGDTSPVPNLYRYDRLLGTNSILTAGQMGLSPVSWDSGPVINSDGRTVAFLSLGSGLVSEDLNRAPDAFAYAIDIGMPLDSDGDGIPDWWMILYFGHPTGQAGDLSLAQDDADGTGMSNLEKYLVGLNPTNPASVFRITTISPHGTNVLVSWQAGSGRTNVVQAAATVNGPYSDVSPDISLPGSGDVFTNYLDLITNQPSRFYRIRLGP
jgi:Tol biopolymer transport system component